jgi:hypothetical protein
MGQIYNRARQVIAWLGDPTSGSSSGMKLLRFLGSVGTDNQHISLDDISRTFSDLAGDVPMASADEIFDFNNAACQGAMSLVTRSWFSRLWVVQEAVLSRDLELRCGSHIISGDSFFKAIQMISSMKPFPLSSLFAEFDNAGKIGSLRAHLNSAQYTSCLDLAHQLSSWNCSDDRDRLHAIMGMMHKDTSSWFAPSYTATVEDLYEDYARGHISTTGSLDILHFAGNSRVFTLASNNICFVFSTTDSSCTLPSWAPDWRIRTRPTPLHLRLEENIPSKSPANTCKPKCSFDLSQKMLSVRGRLVDEVAQVGPPLGEGVHTAVHPILPSAYGLKWQKRRSKELKSYTSGLLQH